MSSPSYVEMFQIFGRIGVLSFGGPAAQIALMHRELVEERDWLSEEHFLRALSLCMFLPGPEAMQLATYAGWRLRGTIGGLISGGLFVVPGALVILVLALIYIELGQVPVVQAAFLGIKAAVVVIVFQALAKVAEKSLTSRGAWALAGGAFLGLFALGLPYPLIIVLAAGYGAFFLPKPGVSTILRHDTRSHPLRTALIWTSLWAAPVVLVISLDHTFLSQIALFFSKLAVVTFGGAYAVLAYMTQTIVSENEWITTAQMIDALGLAETTPGPLILVTEFVALLAGYAEGGVALALAAGAMTLWVTFIPCFLWIFLAGPYLDRIANHPHLATALAAVTAAVVGVIMNLALWFGMHLLFSRLVDVAWLAAPLPDPVSLNFRALTLVMLAAVLLLGLRWGMVQSLAAMAVAGLAFSLL